MPHCGRRPDASLLGRSSSELDLPSNWAAGPVLLLRVVVLPAERWGRGPAAEAGLEECGDGRNDLGVGRVEPLP